MTGMLQACLNGARRPDEHPGLPVRPTDIGAAAAAAVAAGAGTLHVHPKDPDGVDTLEPSVVAAVVEAVREAVPDTSIGLTTGLWAASDSAARRAMVGRWPLLPDYVSVNWSEPGSADLAAELLDSGVGIEAGLWTVADIEVWSRWPHRSRCLRVMLEVVEDLPAAAGLAVARALVAGVSPDVEPPVLLHGNGASAWPILEEAFRQGLDTRIGLEDVLSLPDGGPVTDNAELVTAAVVLRQRMGQV